MQRQARPDRRTGQDSYSKRQGSMDTMMECSCHDMHGGARSRDDSQNEILKFSPEIGIYFDRGRVPGAMVIFSILSMLH